MKDNIGVKNSMSIPSLRPYVEPAGAKPHLRFSLIPQIASVREKPCFPFLVIDDSNPFARLIEARFVTDAGSEIKRLFVLLQKDEYLIQRDELWPINNPDVEQCWQKAFSFYSEKPQNDSVVVLSDQIAKGGGLASLQPLFFCTAKETFFHPLCPKCGTPVQQCYDDDLLTGLGFQPYSTSLKRYLFCPLCLRSEGETDFYAFSLETSDPPKLKDRWDLIREFALLTQGKGQLGDFPCTECPNRKECYGSDGLAVSRIVPFSFYPFCMLIFEAMSVSALDFLSLISGASFEDLESRLGERQQLGRISCLNALKRNGPATPLFFIGRDERQFLEILYLKLSFLGELIQTVFSGLDTYQYPDFGLSVDQIWVKLADQGGLLPFLWNFKVKVINIGGSGIKSPFLPKLAPGYGLHFLGLLWFYTLLVNKKQGVSEVYTALGQEIEEISSNDDATLEGFLKKGFNRVLSPENIFWDPDEKKQLVTENRWPLWRASLGLGWALLNVSLSMDSKWSKDGFREELENLREEVKSCLFRQGSTVGRAEKTLENKAIHDILMKLMGKRRCGLEAEKDKAEEADLEKTVIVSTTDRAGLDDRVAVFEDEQDVEETIILSAEDFEKHFSLPGKVRQTSETGQNDIPETVVMPRSEWPSPSLESSQSLQPQRGSIGKRGTPLEKEPERSVRHNITAEESDGDDSLAKTVVLSPDKVKGIGS